MKVFTRKKTFFNIFLRLMKDVSHIVLSKNIEISFLRIRKTSKNIFYLFLIFAWNHKWKKSDDDGFFLPYIHSHSHIYIRVCFEGCINCLQFKLQNSFSFKIFHATKMIWIVTLPYAKRKNKKNICICMKKLKKKKKMWKVQWELFSYSSFYFFILLLFFCLPFALSVSCMRSWDSWKREDQQLSWRKNEGKNHHFAHTHIWQSGSSTIHLKNPQHNLLWAFSWMDVCCCCCSLNYVTVFVEENDVEE